MVDEEHVLRLAQSEEPLPPILVHRQTKRVIDGVHRLRAAALNGRRHIEVVFFEGAEEEAFIRAVEENIRHGLPLPLMDRKAAALRIIATQSHLSDRTIAKHTGLAAKTIAAIRRSSAEEPGPNRRTSADGRQRPLSGSEGRIRAAATIERHPDASIREIARISDVSIGTAHDVRRRLRSGQGPLPERARTIERDTGASASGASTTPPAGPVKPDCRPVPNDVSVLLRQLAKDPALRHSDLGRELLRLLHLATKVADYSTFIDAMPSHCAQTVAAVARHYAEGWERLASAAEEKAKALD